jgi:tetratricopeptide (TPR) repeat protein
MGRKTALPTNPFVVSQPALQRLSVEQMFALAAQHHAQGRPQESETLLRQILQAQPDHAYALLLLGIIAHQAGNPEKAIELIERAIAVNGKAALFHVNLCGIYRDVGRIADAIAHGERAVALDPAMPVTYFNLGLAYHDDMQYDKDEACQLQVLKLQPGHAVALYNMGRIMHKRKLADEAIAYFRRAIAAQPGYLEALNNLGGVLVEQDRPDEALAVLGCALKLDPDCVLALCNAGNALNNLERFDEALVHLAQALKLHPDHPDALLGIAKVFLAKHELAEAERAALCSLELTRDKKAEVHCLLGGIYRETGETAKAAANFDRALELDPESTDVLLGKGNFCQEMGNLEMAAQLCDKALKLSPSKLNALCALVQARKVRAGDENMAALVALAEQTGKLPELQLRTLHFALGKCYDDIGQPDLAFKHFQEGGRLKRKHMDYDPDAQGREFDRIMAIFDQANLARLRTGGLASDLPVFVLGMPRSGTTLTEQIIASHPDVHGAGELPYMIQIAKRPTAAGDIFPGNLTGLTPELVTAWAGDYLDGLKKRAPDARRITDKMPGNFLILGLIHAMLPNAKIIHVSRHPVDTCLSCFTKQFNHNNIPYSYDLTELGRYYTDYTRLMAHWRQVLPEGAFLDVRYEDLVADTEAQARRLIEYCGLEWNDACLEFHKTKRAVRTASVMQVRQPIYTTSVERWRQYEPFLKPLLDELGDLV